MRETMCCMVNIDLLNPNPPGNPMAWVITFKKNVYSTQILKIKITKKINPSYLLKQNHMFIKLFVHP